MRALLSCPGNLAAAAAAKKKSASMGGEGVGRGDRGEEGRSSLRESRLQGRPRAWDLAVELRQNPGMRPQGSAAGPCPKGTLSCAVRLCLLFTNRVSCLPSAQASSRPPSRKGSARLEGVQAFVNLWYAGLLISECLQPPNAPEGDVLIAATRGRVRPSLLQVMKPSVFRAL